MAARGSEKLQKWGDLKGCKEDWLEMRNKGRR